MNELCLFDGIGLDPETGTGMTAKAFDAQLKALGSPQNILLRINSPGGAVMDGMAIYSVLKATRAKVTARIEGLAASAASLIAMACDRIEIASNAFMLIHQPYTTAQGTAESLNKAADDLQLLETQYAKIYAARTGQPLADVVALMAEDRLMGAEEALELGYVDAITDEVPEANLAMVPGQYRAQLQDEIDPAVLHALAARVGDLTAAVQSVEKARHSEIRDLGKIAGMPRLAAKLIREGVSANAALKRFRAVQRRKQAEIAKGWDLAAAALRGDAKPASPDPHGWGAAIKLAGLKANG